MAANSRRKSVVTEIGRPGTAQVKVGGGNPIVVQSMTNTDTADAPSTR
jgi:4-hydroxy-3-methylbut-2-en-1-yl diphosphate synthase IspG/GcpE